MNQTEIKYRNLPNGRVLVTEFVNVASESALRREFGDKVVDKYLKYELDDGTIGARTFYYRHGLWVTVGWTYGCARQQLYLKKAEYSVMDFHLLIGWMRDAKKRLHSIVEECEKHSTKEKTILI